MYRVAVDETKRSSYAMVAALCPQREVPRIRRELAAARLPNRDDIHMHRDVKRRGALADCVASLNRLGVRAIVYDAGRRGPSEIERRGRCLTHITADLIAMPGRHELVLDRDQSLVTRDRQLLLEANRRCPPAERIEYHHLTTKEDLLIGIADVVAWSWARGGLWLDRVAPVIEECIEV